MRQASKRLKIMRYILAFIFLTVMSTSAFAKIVTKEVDYMDGNLALRGTLAYDDTIEGKMPGILLFPEWWGHNEYIKKRAVEMAEHGYVAFAADMYGVDKITTKANIAQEWSKPLYDNRATMRKRAHAAMNILKQQKNVDKKKLVAVGFCMGGTVALELARSGSTLKAVSAFHSGLQFPDQIKNGAINTKFLVMNGGADSMVQSPERQNFIDEMQAAGLDLQFILYSGAQHAFTNPSANTYGIKSVAYDSKAERRSFQAMYNFFTEVLSY
jgi:dienelactone hydrolase